MNKENRLDNLWDPCKIASLVLVELNLLKYNVWSETRYKNKFDYWAVYCSSLDLFAVKLKHQTE